MRKRLTSTLLFGALICLFSPLQGSELEIVEDESIIAIKLRGKPVIEYLKESKPVPDGLKPVYARSGYIHPVYSPKGQIVTGDYAEDHPHQHGLFFAWTKTSFDGQMIDFWNQHKGLGTVEHRGVGKKSEEDDRVSFTVNLAHVAKMDGKKIDVLNETWTVTVHHTPESHYIFDIESIQQCATEKPLILEKHKYGGMALRCTSQWLDEEGKNPSPGGLEILTSEGKNRSNGNHTQTNWVAYSGNIDDQPTTIAVFGSPKNFRSPQHVRIHPDKPYFCFAPMVGGKFKIEPGEQYVSRFRYLVTSDKIDKDLLNQEWEKYSKQEK